MGALPPRETSGPATSSALVLDGVTAGYGTELPVLEDVSLEVGTGECVAVLGPSGSGKTTLLRLVLGILSPRRGTVRTPPAEGADDPAPRIGYIPQNLGLVRNLTARENVLLGALSRLRWWHTLVGRFPAKEREAADDALARVRLEGRGDERVERMSGGERRRVAVARALLQRPEILLADEFLAELDPLTAEDVLDLLDDLRTATGLTLVMVDHDVATACRVADRVVVLRGGRVSGALTGPAIDPDRVKDLFRRADDDRPDPDAPIGEEA